MSVASKKWLHRLEIVFWIIGLCFIGVATGSTLTRWQYQQQQERALFERGPAVSSTPSAVAPAKTIAASPVSPVEVSKPAAAKVVQPKKSSPYAADPLAVGRVEIPRLGLKAIVRQGADEKTLSRAVGLLPGSAPLGEVGNVVLAGHRDTFFWPLQDIEVGDQIRIVVPQQTYRYRVESLAIVDPHETSVLAPKGVEELTLITCYPFRYVGASPQRFIVTAVRVQ